MPSGRKALRRSSDSRRQRLHPDAFIGDGHQAPVHRDATIVQRLLDHLAEWMIWSGLLVRLAPDDTAIHAVRMILVRATDAVVSDDEWRSAEGFHEPIMLYADVHTKSTRR